MSYKFSRSSREELATVHLDLVRVMEAAIQYTDFKVIEGHRGQAEQDAAYRGGFSKVRWPNGKHNTHPSRAVDIAPYPIAWGDTERFIFLAGVVMTCAQQLGVKVRWGGDWDRDRMLDADEKGKLRDWGHFELLEG